MANLPDEKHETLRDANETGENSDEDEKELEHFKRIVKSFKLYGYHSTKRVARSLENYHDLSEKQRKYIGDFEDNCKELLNLIDHNSKMIELLVEDVECMFENSVKPINENEEIDEYNTNANLVQNMERVSTTLKQIMRDWSSEGKSERDCYKVIINELKSLFKTSNPEELKEISVLVPGSGLARLAFEIAALGFKCQGNEFSLHMLIASNFILNKCQRINEYTIYPFVNSWCNNLSFENQRKAIKFPDLDFSKYTSNLSQFSMAAGDFLDIYKNKEEWNSVVTCFFIDTAHNVVDYIEKIWHILKPNGYWINFGPLLYHFSDIAGEKSIELNYEQIKNVIKQVGFKYVKENTKVNSKYLFNESSMLKYTYDSVFFVVQKPA